MQTEKGVIVLNEWNSFRFDLWLYNEMRKRGWNTQDLAEKAGITRQAVVFYLADERLPTMRTLAEILSAFDMHMEFVDN